MAALEPIGEIEKIVGELQGLTLGALFEDAELRRACAVSLKDWGCPSFVARLAVEAIAGLVTFCKEGVAAGILRNGGPRSEDIAARTMVVPQAQLKRLQFHHLAATNATVSSKPLIVFPS